MSLTNLELKQICKNKGVKGYSQLNKEDLVKLLRKNIKSGGHKIASNTLISSGNDVQFWMAYSKLSRKSGTFKTINVHSKINMNRWNEIINKTSLNEKDKKKILDYIKKLIPEYMKSKPEYMRYPDVSLSISADENIEILKESVGYFQYYVPVGIKYKKETKVVDGVVKPVKYDIDDSPFWIDYFVRHLTNLLITPLNNNRTNSSSINSSIRNNSRTNTSSINNSGRNSSGTNNY